MSKKLAVGVYEPTESFKSIPEHIAVMFDDDQTLVSLIALVGAADDEPKNLTETVEYAKLFSASPVMRDALLEIIEQCDEAMGEWNSIAFDYLPETMERYYGIRQSAREALEGIENLEIEVAYNPDDFKPLHPDSPIPLRYWRNGETLKVIAMEDQPPGNLWYEIDQDEFEENR